MRDPKEKVVLAYIRPSLVNGDFMECVLDLLAYDNSLHNRIISGDFLRRLSLKSGSNLSQARNKVVEQFLAFGEADWLFMIDTDMTFGADVVERLLEHADPEKAPIVGGLCFGFTEDGAVMPTLFGMVDLEDDGNLEFIRYSEWKPDAMMQVVATGAACMLVHKSALETVRDMEFPDRPGKRGFNSVFPWFQETELNGRVIGEDITFCIRANQCEIPVYVNTAVQIGHIKDRILNMNGYFASRGLLSYAHDGVGA